MQYDVIVIGGGASGIFAAIHSAMRGRRTLILEKNQTLGKKLSITGGGRCNITNAEYDIHTLLAHYGDAQPYLYGLFSQFGVQNTFDYFTQRGLGLVVENNKRAFPYTFSAPSVVKLLVNELNTLNVEMACDTEVIHIQTSDSTIIGVQTKNGVYSAMSYIIATGGASHAETGATGDGFRFLTQIGHSVATPTPSIVPLAVSDKWVQALSGQSLDTMKITFYLDGKKAFSKTGSLLFTHFGISGPCILNSASKVADLLRSGTVVAKINSYPEYGSDRLDMYLIDLFDQNKNKLLQSIMREIYRFGDNDFFMSILAIAGIDNNILETRVHSITKSNRKKLVSILQSLPITITGLMGMDRAVVADGGVSLEEIDMKTMRSKLYNNLFITGDLLDINRPSGGYSLQICWTTGFVAGINA